MTMITIASSRNQSKYWCGMLLAVVSDQVSVP
jgi:hypothetical protein